MLTLAQGEKPLLYWAMGRHYFWYFMVRNKNRFRQQIGPHWNTTAESLVLRIMPGKQQILAVIRITLNSVTLLCPNRRGFVSILKQEVQWQVFEGLYHDLMTFKWWLQHLQAVPVIPAGRGRSRQSVLVEFRLQHADRGGALWLPQLWWRLQRGALAPATGTEACTEEGG